MTSCPATSVKRAGADGARQHDNGLLQREGGADADPRPGAERQIGEAVDAVAPLRQEALGHEGVGVVPEPPMAMKHPGSDRHHRATRDLEIADPVLAERCPAHIGHGRIEPHRLLDDGLGEDEPRQRLRGEDAVGHDRVDLGLDRARAAGACDRR